MASTPGRQALMHSSQPLQASTSMLTVPRLTRRAVMQPPRSSRGHPGAGVGPAGPQGRLVDRQMLGAVGRYELLHNGHQGLQADHAGGGGVAAEEDEAGAHGRA